MLPAPLSPASTVVAHPLRPLPGGPSGQGLAAVMPSEHRECVPHPRVLLHRDARRIGPDRSGVCHQGRMALRADPFPIVAPAVPVGLSGLAAFGTGGMVTGPGTPFGASRRWVPSGGWSGSEKALPSARRFQPYRCCRQPGFLPALRPWVPWLPCRPESPSALPKQGFHRSVRTAAIRSTTARHSLHLRFARFPFRRTSRGVFSDAAAGIAVASPGLNFSISFRGLLLKKPGNSRRSTRGSCAP